MNRFCFVLIPGFSLVAFSCAVDALRAANNIEDQKHYTWETAAPGGKPVISSSAIPLPTQGLSAVEDPDVIVVCGGDRSHEYKNAELTNWLHRHAKRGRLIGSISDGAFVVAQAGLFDDTPSTIHWKCLEAYRERFPDLLVKPSIIEVSEKRFSCAGGTSSLDLMLHFISRERGHELAGKIADNYFHNTIRDGTEEQHLTQAYRIARKVPRVSEALLLMEDHLENPLTISAIADRLKLSRRQLDRLFKQETDSTPQMIYRDLRLTRASGLLLQTGMSIAEISVACGFQSASHIGVHFKKRFGFTPLDYRRRYSQTG